MLLHPKIFPRLSLASQTLTYVVYSSMAELERHKLNPSQDPKILDILVMPLGEAVQENPETIALRVCHSTPGTFCVCIAAYTTPASLQIYDFICLPCRNRQRKKNKKREEQILISGGIDLL